MTYLEIPAPRLALALGLIALAIGLSRLARLGLERDLGLGTVRAAVQLTAIGYGLRLLFAHPSPLAIFGLLALMTAVAAFTSTRRVPDGPGTRELFPYALVAILGGAAIAVLPMMLFVIRPKPWFDGRYVIPIGGMMLSSAMNVVAQVFERLFATARVERPVIEQALALGATPAQSVAPYMRAALRGALTPTINGLVTVGLVALPGMMTGQIVSGAAPEQAVRYQIVIMYQLVAVAAVSGYLAAAFARRLLFTSGARLRAEG